MTTLSGGPRPEGIVDDQVLTAQEFIDATRFWVVDDVPSDAEGNDGDVVFALTEGSGVHAKNNGTWVPVGPAVNISAEGTPGAPELVDNNGNPDTSGGSVIYFKPAPEGAAGPTLAHGASISPNDNGEFVTVDQDNLEVTVLGTTPFTDYIVSVYGVNEAGRGDIAKTDAFQLNYNEATGGTETIVDNYNGTGQKWKVHTMVNGDLTFTVDTSINDFRVLVQAAGGGGQSVGGGVTSNCNGNGGSGVDQTTSLDKGEYALNIAPGSGGNGPGPNASRCVNGGGETGKPTTFHTWTVNGGAGGGCPGAGGKTVGPRSDITGTELQYGGYNSTVYGAGKPGAGNANGAGGGKPGCVIIAYQIGTSTTREIQQAQAEAAARSAGVEEGIQQGYSQAQEDLQEELTSLRTQIAGAVGTTETMLIDGKEQEIKRTRKGRRK